MLLGVSGRRLLVLSMVSPGAECVYPPFLPLFLLRFLVLRSGPTPTFIPLLGSSPASNTITKDWEDAATERIQELNLGPHQSVILPPALVLHS